MTKDPESIEGQFTKAERPKKVSNEAMLKIKEVIIGNCLAGAVISQKMVISTGTGVLKANNPNSLSEFGGNVTLTNMWATGDLKSMDWVKRKGSSSKVQPLKKLLAEKKPYISDVSKVVYEHDIA